MREGEKDEGCPPDSLIPGEAEPTCPHLPRASPHSAGRSEREEGAEGRIL